jgi:transposase
VIETGVAFISIEAHLEETARYQKEIDRCLEAIARCEQKIGNREDTITLLLEMVATLKAGMFGRKSEKLDPNQFALLPGIELPSDGDSQPDENPTVVKEHVRKKKGHGRTEFPANLPRHIVPLDLPEEEKFCPDCGIALNRIKEETCERGHIVPIQVTVIRYVKQKYACPNGHCVKTPPTPNSLLERCKYEPSVYAHLAVSKYQDHLPLHRMEGIYKRNGLHLPRSTMWEMLARLTEIVLLPVIKQMKLELLMEPILHADNTGVKVRIEEKKGMREGQIWTWLSADEKKILHDFTMSKGRDGPVDFLKSWTGILVADGAPNFNKVIATNKIVRAGCWVHAARGAKNALKLKDKNSIRLVTLNARLSNMENRIIARAKRRSLSTEEAQSLRNTVRNRTGRRIVDAIMDESRRLLRKHEVLPKSVLGKAAQYILNQEEPLRAFLKDSRIPLTNNAAERALRPVAVGRNNWLFLGSGKGGEVASAMYSIMLSCRALEVNPEAYVKYITEAIAKTPATQIATLTPWAYAASQKQA